MCVYYIYINRILCYSSYSKCYFSLCRIQKLSSKIAKIYLTRSYSNYSKLLERCFLTLVQLSVRYILTIYLLMLSYATQKRIISQGHLTKYSYRTRSRKKESSSNCYCSLESRENEEKEITCTLQR